MRHLVRSIAVVLTSCATGALAMPWGGPMLARKAACAAIAPVSVTTASGGYLLTFRYKVLDAEAAAPLFARAVKPVIVDRATKEALVMPRDSKLGALRSSPRAKLLAGKQYYVLFSNADRHTKPHAHVDVLLGACRFDDLEVR